MSRILIVDDNLQNLYLIRFLLEQCDHDIDEAHNGEEAIATLKTKVYDLILMDVQMPVLDGLEATRRIKAEYNTPIVALTAKSMTGDREAILQAGCDGYIQKPIDPALFAGQVELFLT